MYNSAVKLKFKISRTTAVCVIMMLLSVLSLFFSPIVYLAFLFGIVSLILVSAEDIFAFLLFIFPYAVVLKAYNGSLSLFTLIELAALLILLFHRMSFDAFFLAGLFCLFSIIIFKTTSIIALIKFACIPVLFYLFTTFYSEEYAGRYFRYFSAGILTSTVVGIFKEKIPRLLSLYDDLNYEWIDGNNTLRFSGIYSDPNYFSIPLILIIIVICASIMYSGKLKPSSLVLLGIFSIFGAATFSKSFYLCCVAIILVMLTRGKHRWRRIFSVFAIGTVIILIDPFNIVSNITYRMNSTDLTTGRFEIWQNYFQVIFNSVSGFITGYGLNAPYIDRPAHSIFIESLYLVGLLGTLLYVFLLIYITEYGKFHFKRTLVNYLGFFMVVLMYSFLSGLTAFEFPFYMMIAYIIFNCDYQSGQYILGKSMEDKKDL